MNTVSSKAHDFKVIKDTKFRINRLMIQHEISIIFCVNALDLLVLIPHINEDLRKKRQKFTSLHFITVSCNNIFFSAYITFFPLIKLIVNIRFYQALNSIFAAIANSSFSLPYSISYSNGPKRINDITTVWCDGCVLKFFHKKKSCWFAFSTILNNFWSSIINFSLFKFILDLFFAFIIRLLTLIFIQNYRIRPVYLPNPFYEFFFFFCLLHWFVITSK